MEIRMDVPEIPSASAAPYLLNQERAAKIATLSKSDQVYLHIKDLIMHYVLKPGQKILGG